MLIKETKGIGSRFSCVPAGMKRHSLDLLQAVKNIVGCGSVCMIFFSQPFHQSYHYLYLLAKILCPVKFNIFKNGRLLSSKKAFFYTGTNPQYISFVVSFGNTESTII